MNLSNESIPKRYRIQVLSNLQCVGEAKILIFNIMKLFEKYAKLRQKAYVASMVTKSVSGSMALENQEVPEPQVKAIVIALLREAELKGREFSKD